jgi:import inner membrane translocase subunit TIM21
VASALAELVYRRFLRFMLIALSCTLLPFSTSEDMSAIYKPTEAIQLLRPCMRQRLPIPRKRTTARFNFSTSRAAQATHSSTSSSPTPPPPPPGPMRRQVTVTNDTGRVRWTELSPGEKAARTVQQSWNLSIVLVGVVMTVRIRGHCGGYARIILTPLRAP